MPTTKKKSAKKKPAAKRFSASKKPAAKRSAGSKKPAAKPAAKRSTGGKRRGTVSARATAHVKDTALKVLAGAAAGAVRAIIPSLEKVADERAQAAGIEDQAGKSSRDSGE
jgi:hypothetical protein